MSQCYCEQCKIYDRIHTASLKEVENVKIDAAGMLQASEPREAQAGA